MTLKFSARSLNSSLFFRITLFLFFLSILNAHAQQSDEIDKLIDQGIQYERENKLEKAIEIYTEILEIDDANILVKVRLAKVLSWKNEFEGALTLLEEVLRQENLHSEGLLETS